MGFSQACRSVHVRTRSAGLLRQCLRTSSKRVAARLHDGLDRTAERLIARAGPAIKQGAVVLRCAALFWTIARLSPTLAYWTPSLLMVGKSNPRNAAHVGAALACAVSL
jgi:hypothetical protein